mgnify:CR=1 FL=1
METHVESDAANSADLRLRERGQDDLDLLLVARALTRVENGAAREGLDLDGFARKRRQADILRRVGRLTDKWGRAGDWHKADEARPSGHGGRGVEGRGDEVGEE